MKKIPKIPMMKTAKPKAAKSGAGKAVNIALAKTAPMKSVKGSAIKPLGGKSIAIPSFKPPAMPTKKK